ncbi:M4 family metallopeptidase [Streptomyces sp. NPDC086023]|uniref:M4 family metallopeptidase n=1 Tax=Streptomyces sp. NPDC086023 TaxID=3365746 RepID=UPI0037CEEA1D
MRSTPHTSRRAVRLATSCAAAAVVLAVVAPAAPAAPATPDRADSTSSTPAAAVADRGALPVALTPARRRDLLHRAEAGSDATRRGLGLGAGERLHVRDVVQDGDGTVHTRYERTYDGLPVLGGDLVVHTGEGGAVKGVTWARAASVAAPRVAPHASPATVRRQALAAAGEHGAVRTRAGGTRQVVWAAQGTPVRAFETVVDGFRRDGTPSELHVVADARTGARLYAYDAVHSGTGETQYSGTVPLGSSFTDPSYVLTDTDRGNHSTYNLNRGTSGTGSLFSGPDDVWGNGTASDPETAGADAHFGAAMTWDYYKNVHGRNGLRDDGVAPYSRVHYGNNYVNAFWQDSCFCMTYGDGSGNAKPLTSIDVAAHEMTHGLTSVTARLVYSGESGGLNEATSDIMAAAVEFSTANASDVGDYLVGEKIDIRGTGAPLRYMDKPSKDGVSKDSWYAGIGGIDVHYSSGPANHWFYLASEGSGPKVVNGVAYDSPTSDGLPVTGIGRAAAERIWFRALTVYMTSNTTYAGARTATLQAAADLYGFGSPTYNNAANAWAAVNVGPRILDGVTVVAPADQYSTVGQTAALAVRASSTNPGALAYEASGLPAGLSIDPADGRISGTFTEAGRHAVTITVTDGAGERGSAGFTWTVDEEGNGSVFENTDDHPIADESTVESPVRVNRAGPASGALTVDVRIVHTWRGDLVIDLVAPDGTAYRLKNAAPGDSADDVIERYTVDASDKAAAGVWKLRVQDVARLDTGYVDSWRLTF